VTQTKPEERGMKERVEFRGRLDRYQQKDGNAFGF